MLAAALPTHLPPADVIGEDVYNIRFLTKSLFQFFKLGINLSVLCFLLASRFLRWGASNWIACASEVSHINTINKNKLSLNMVAISLVKYFVSTEMQKIFHRPSQRKQLSVNVIVVPNDNDCS